MWIKFIKIEVHEISKYVLNCALRFWRYWSKCSCPTTLQDFLIVNISGSYAKHWYLWFFSWWYSLKKVAVSAFSWVCPGMFSHAQTYLNLLGVPSAILRVQPDQNYVRMKDQLIHIYHIFFHNVIHKISNYWLKHGAIILNRSNNS